MNHIITWLKSVFSSDDKPVIVELKRNVGDSPDVVRVEPLRREE